MTQKSQPIEEREGPEMVAAGSPIYRIEIGPRFLPDLPETNHHREHDFQQMLRQLGLPHLDRTSLHRLYFIEGSLTESQLDQLINDLLADPVTEQYAVERLPAASAEFPSPSESDNRVFPGADHTIDVTLLPGVTDPAADNLVRAAHLMDMGGVVRAATGQRFLLWGELDQDALSHLATGICANPVIQRYAIDRPISPPFFSFGTADETVEIIPLSRASDPELEQISQKRRLALNLQEMRAIRCYYQEEGREPTDVELETLAQTWSEHCVHKTFRATIRYHGPAGADPYGPAEEQTIPGLLRSYIRAATERVNRPWVRSAFVDNAGIIAFDDQYDLAFKVETHNHPSALEPFGGANTGVGGVIRDVLGVSARPIANTDILCFGPPELTEEQLPAGVLHPQRIAEGVVRGIEDYGNKMGIPTVNGAIVYHPGYTANPLVYCGCLGLLPHNSHPTEAQDGDLIVAIGGRTGRDGLRGATFSSMEMDTTTGQIAGSAVQIGNPIQEKQILEVVLRARDERLYNAITDCGAGGFSSAVGEMGAHLGARVELADAPLKYPGLRPWEIWLSEAQERMVLAVPQVHWPRLQAVCAAHDVEATCIGVFEDSGRLRIFYRQRLVGDLSMQFLHEGIPARQMNARWQPPDQGELNASPGASQLTPNEALLALLAHPDIRSKEDVIRRYDHEVQGGTAVKPLVGVEEHGPGDATVLIPLTAQRPAHPDLPIRGVAVANGICPAYGERDPYAMAWAAIDEAMRNLVAVGADPDQVALLDNFCWGNPNVPDRLGALVRCAQGCFDAAVAYNAPFISGKDSLNNEFTGADGQKHAIPGTLLISSIGIVPDTRRTVTMALKQEGNLLFIIGDTRPELGGSHYSTAAGMPAIPVNRPPQPIDNPLQRYRALHRAMQQGLVQACHDCSEGGLAIALAEMCLAGRLGARIGLVAPGLDGESALSDEVRLFSESLGRLVIEVAPADVPAFADVMAGIPHARLGQVTGSALLVTGQDGEPAIRLSVERLEAAWRGHLEFNRPPAGPASKTSATPPLASAPAHRRPPRVLILHANGTNRDQEAALACEEAGGEPEIVHVNQLFARERELLSYHMLILPGGFSYGDDLGAGTLWALDLRHRLRAQLARFVRSGRPVLGICNGFQALVKSGLLPGQGGALESDTVSNHHNSRPLTLAPNNSGLFECRWVYLQPNPVASCLFTEGLDDLILCPVAHGEGRFAVQDESILSALQENGLIALTYVDHQGRPGGYPVNPNGSVLNIAGICNAAGNVLGLMPHPEDHIFAWQHPHRHRGGVGMSGLPLFTNALKHA